MLRLATFTLAFCSVVYELLLGQTLAAFLGNTVLRFSVTIGLYMLSMGVGAFLCRGRVLERPVIHLQRVEVALTVLGATSAFLVLCADALTGSPLVVSAVGHTLIVVIGVLTGMEIPLLIDLEKSHGDAARAESLVIGIDYLGAFTGMLAFAFVLYPVAGITATALLIALLNAAVGVALYTQEHRIADDRRTQHAKLLALQSCLLLALVVALPNAETIHDFFTSVYLSA